MMDLSPLDVRKKKEDFDRALRGYDASQVESFLDVVAERLEELVSERRRLRDRVSTLEEQLSDYRERERALNDALLSAQELREDARSQAEREVELRRQEAEARAEEIVRDARERAGEVRRDLERLRLKREQLLRSIRGTLRRFQDELDVEETRHAGEGPDAGEEEARAARETFAAGAHGRVTVRDGNAPAPAGPGPGARDTAGARDPEAGEDGEGAEGRASATEAPRRDEEASSDEELDLLPDEDVAGGTEHPERER